MPTIPDQPPRHTETLSAEAAVVFAAEQLEALAEAEERAAQDSAANHGYWRFSDDAADHAAAALALRRRARQLLTTGRGQL